MLTFILILTVLIVFLTLGFCFHLVGSILKLVLKLAVCLPCAVLCAAVGVIFCCTLLFIPLGVGCFKMAGFFLHPFKPCLI